MVKITIDNIVPSDVPDQGWRVEYRIKDTTGAYIVPTGSPFMELPIEFTTLDPAGTLYEGHVWRDCGTLESTKFNWITPCDCTDVGFDSTGTDCRKTEIVAADVTHSDFCLAASVNGAYGNYGARIYKLGFTSAAPFYPPGTINSQIYGEMSLVPQWANTLINTTDGPLNREGVWIDSDCDGNKNSLTEGAQTTIAFQFNNTGLARTIYVGVGADNQFKLVVNGAILIDTLATVHDQQFKFWHIFPVHIITGLNNFNLVATGDGTVNDAMGMVVYNNTNAEIFAATADAQLAILFKSGVLRGTSYDVATCPDGYSLDTSGGTGHYVCTRTLIEDCNSA